MSPVDPLKEFISVRLTAVAEEIFLEFRRTIVQYEEEIYRQRELLENKPMLSLHADQQIIPAESKPVPTIHAVLECQTFYSTDKELASDQQEPEVPQAEEEQTETFTGLLVNIVTDGSLWNEQNKSSPDQDRANSLQIKEEQKEVEVHQVNNECHFSNNQTEGEQLILKQETETLTMDGANDGSNQQTPDTSSSGDFPSDFASSVYGQHITLHSNEKKPYACNLCGKRFTYLSLVKCHILLHSDEKHQFCRICGKSFTLNCDLPGHIQSIGEKMFTCNLCESKQGQRSSPAKKTYSCRICAKSFGRRYCMVRHMITHTGEKPFSCPVCGERFGLKSHLQRHMRIHTGEKPFRCLICHKSFSERGGLRDHAHSHSGEKPHKCTECGKGFLRSCYLNIHMRIHTGEKPHSCTDCGKSFISSYKLKEHQKNHTAEKRFSCEICGRHFRLKSNLTRHCRALHS